MNYRDPFGLQDDDGEGDEEYPNLPGDTGGDWYTPGNSYNPGYPLTQGKTNALLYDIAGIGTISFGIATIDPVAIAFGIGLVAYGAPITAIEFGLNGDTSGIPFGPQILWGIGKGIYNSVCGKK